MLSNLQLICFEVADKCNLGAAHSFFCPASREYRHRKKKPATNEDFLFFLDYCIRKQNFNGRIGFHYYCEPTLDLPRCKILNEEIHKRNLKTVVWTNGTCKEDLSMFDDVYATQYADFEVCSKKIPYAPDDRLQIYDTEPKAPSDYIPCVRPSHMELPIDFYGDIHMCCSDWCRERKIGNIYKDGNANIIENWKRTIDAAKQGCDICYKCQNLKNSPACHDTSYKI